MYKVLLIDDESWILEDLKNLLDWNEFGFQIVGEAKNTIQADAIIKKLEPDIIISDIRLPGMDGLEFVEKVKRKKNIITIFISAYSRFEYAQKAILLGAFDYLLKPVEKEKLMQTLIRAKVKLDNNKKLKINIDDFGKTKLLYGLLEHSNNPLEIKKQFNEFGFTLSKNCFFMCLVRSERELGESNMFEGIPDWDNFYIPLSNFKFICILQTGKEVLGLKDYVKLLKELNVRCEKYGLFLGASKAINDMKNLRLAHRQSDTALDTMFLLKGKRVCFYRESKNGVKEVNNLMAKCKNNTEIFEFLNKLPSYIAYYKINIKDFQQIYTKILTTFGIENISEDLDAKEMIFQFQNINALIDYIRNLIDENVKKVAVKLTSKDVIKEITEYIKTNYNQKLMITNLAKKFYLNSSYLSNLFKMETGKSFTNYLVEYRLDRAVELLENQNLTLYEISERVGYDDYFHFSKLFKKYKNISPANYRKNKYKSDG